MLKKTYLGTGIFPNMINRKEFWFDRNTGSPMMPENRYAFRLRSVGRARPDFEKDINFVAVITQPPALEGEGTQHLLMLSDGRTSRFYHIDSRTHKTLAVPAPIHSFNEGITALLQYLLETDTSHSRMFYNKSIGLIIEYLDTEMIQDEIELPVKTVWTGNIKLDLTFYKYPAQKRGMVFVDSNDPLVPIQGLLISLEHHPIHFLVKYLPKLFNKIR